MSRVFQVLVHALVIRPVVLVVLGINVRRRHRLPRKGPAILVSNHNSHLDTVVLMSLFRLRDLARVRPVAAADYFLRNPLLAWFSRTVMGIIPLQRAISREEAAGALDPIVAALEAGDIVVIFPEGTRGEPEEMGRLKNGVSRLAERCPEVPVIPIYLHGLGKALPRGEFLLVPFFIDVFVGETLGWVGDRARWMTSLTESLASLRDECPVPAWDEPEATC